jgi:hypothetical protein
LFGANVETLPISFYKKSREVVEELARSRPSLSGHIYCKNDFSLRWAKFLGFTIKEAEPYGVKNEPFHPFYMEVNKNVS